MHKNYICTPKIFMYICTINYIKLPKISKLNLIPPNYIVEPPSNHNCKKKI